MSTLAHYLEDEGVATTLIGLVRNHVERVQPPRALWVPFELGRPVGAPNEPAFQRRVLTAALNLLDREDGPVILENFAAQAPNSAPAPGWTCPVDLPAPAAEPDGASLKSEIARVAPHFHAAAAAGSHAGAAGLELDDLATYAARFIDGERPDSPLEGYSTALAFRFVVDDLKAVYLEAAAAGGSANSKQLHEWFWDNTVLARALIATRKRLQASDSRGDNVVANYMVPTAQIARLGL